MNNQSATLLGMIFFDGLVTYWAWKKTHSTKKTVIAFIVSFLFSALIGSIVVLCYHKNYGDSKKDNDVNNNIIDVKPITNEEINKEKQLNQKSNELEEKELIKIEEEKKPKVIEEEKIEEITQSKEIEKKELKKKKQL